MENTEVHELRAAIERRTRSIREYSLAQLRECRGPLALHTELVGEIRQDIDIVQGQLEELALLAEEAETSAARHAVLRQVEEVTRQLDGLRKDIREATLTSKRRIDSTHASSHREELFKSSAKAAPITAGQKGDKPRTEASKDDELMSATSNVTDGLRRTRQMMEQELERSSLTSQMLERSSQTLQLTSNQYTSFSDILNASKTLITTLEKADTLDRLLLLAALVFFLLVCLLIVKRRIIDRGLRAASVVGKVAGGVGHVGKRGAKAVLKEATQSLAASVTEAISTATSMAAAASATVPSVAAAVSAKASSATHGSSTSIHPFGRESIHDLPTPSLQDGVAEPVATPEVSVVSADDYSVEDLSEEVLSDLPVFADTDALPEEGTSGLTDTEETQQLSDGAGSEPGETVLVDEEVLQRAASVSRGRRHVEEIVHEEL